MPTKITNIIVIWNSEDITEECHKTIIHFTIQSICQLLWLAYDISGEGILYRGFTEDPSSKTVTEMIEMIIIDDMGIDPHLHHKATTIGTSTEPEPERVTTSNK